MAALAAARITTKKNGLRRRGPVAASAVVWQGGIVAWSGSGANAKLVAASADNTLRVAGVAVSTGDNRVAGPSAVYAEYETGVFLMNNDSGTPLTIGDIGADCYVVDDNTVSKSSSSNARPKAGVVFDVDSSGVWVKFA